jgi:hypothetical protein
MCTLNTYFDFITIKHNVGILRLMINTSDVIMHKTTRQNTHSTGENEMAKYVCNSVGNASKTALQQSVEQLIQKNRKVFDNLAKA